MRSAEQLRKDAADLHSRANRLLDEAEKLERKEAAHVAESAARVGAAVREKLAKVLPVDRKNQRLTSGAPVPDDRSHTELTASGQQKAYVVLSDDERRKGFVRPVRDAYRHATCGKITTMSRDIAETYARDPYFYSGTFCATCGAHFPVGEDGEFVWAGTDEKVGT